MLSQWFSLLYLSRNRVSRRPTRRACLTVERLEDRIALAAPAWQPIGPAPITGDNIDGDKVVGRVTAIAIDPNTSGDPNGDTIYIGSAGGGVWVGQNIHTSSPTWTALTDNLAAQINDPLVNLNVGALAATYNSTTDQTILYAGLGEPNASYTTMVPSQGNTQFYGTGIIKGVINDSTPTQATWTLLGGNGASNLFYRKAISKIIIDPTNSNILYAAVATAKNGLRSGEGIWKSTNGGATWTNTTAAAIPGSSQYMFSDLVMDPDNSQVLYAAVGETLGSTVNGVYVTTNGGATWALMSNLPNGMQTGTVGQTPLQGVGRITLAISSNYVTSGSPKYHLYAAFITNAVTQSATITDFQQSGTTVTITYTGFKGLKPFKTGQGVVISGVGMGLGGTETITGTAGNTFTYTADTSQSVTMTGLNGRANTELGNLYQLGYADVAGTMQDSAVAWNVITNFDFPDKDSTENYVGGEEGAQGYYDTALGVDPSTPDHIYAGGQDEFLSVESTTGSPSVTDLEDGSFGSIHVDHHAIAFDRTSTAGDFSVLDGSDGGVFEFDRTTQSWDQRNTGGLQISQFYGIAANSPTDIIGGVQDNGDIVTDGIPTWKDLHFQKSDLSIVEGGDGGQVYLYSSGGTTYAYITNTGKLNLITDPFGTPTPTFIGNGLPDDAPGLFPNQTYLMSPVDFNTLWYGSDTLYMTTDQGTTWTAITAAGQNGWFTPQQTIVNNFAVDDTVVDSIGASAANTSVLYVGARGGHLLVTTTLPTVPGSDPNPTWFERDPVPITPQNQARLADLKYADIQVDPTNANTAYVCAANFGDVTGGAHVWMTTNGGASWKNISGNLPNVPVWSIQLQAPTTPGTLPVLYVGTDVGVFASGNLGAYWARFGSNLPNVQGRALNLYINPLNHAQDELLVGTLGHGAYVLQGLLQPQRVTSQVRIQPLAYRYNAASKSIIGSFLIRNTGPALTGSFYLTFQNLPPGVTVVGQSSVHATLGTGQYLVLTVSFTPASARYLNLLLKAKNSTGQVLYPAQFWNVPI